MQEQDGYRWYFRHIKLFTTLEEIRGVIWDKTLFYDNEGYDDGGCDMTVIFKSGDDIYYIRTAGYWLGCDLGYLPGCKVAYENDDPERKYVVWAPSKQVQFVSQMNIQRHQLALMVEQGIIKHSFVPIAEQLITIQEEQIEKFTGERLEQEITAKEKEIENIKSRLVTMRKDLIEKNEEKKKHSTT